MQQSSSSERQALKRRRLHEIDADFLGRFADLAEEAGMDAVAEALRVWAAEEADAAAAVVLNQAEESP